MAGGGMRPVAPFDYWENFIQQRMGDWRAENDESYDKHCTLLGRLDDYVERMMHRAIALATRLYGVNLGLLYKQELLAYIATNRPADDGPALIVWPLLFLDHIRDGTERLIFLNRSILDVSPAVVNWGMEVNWGLSDRQILNDIEELFGTSAGMACEALIGILSGFGRPVDEILTEILTGRWGMPSDWSVKVRELSGLPA